MLCKFLLVYKYCSLRHRIWYYNLFGICNAFKELGDFTIGVSVMKFNIDRCNAGRRSVVRNVVT